MRKQWRTNVGDRHFDSSPPFPFRESLLVLRRKGGRWGSTRAQRLQWERGKRKCRPSSKVTFARTGWVLVENPMDLIVYVLLPSLVST